MSRSCLLLLIIGCLTALCWSLEYPNYYPNYYKVINKWIRLWNIYMHFSLMSSLSQMMIMMFLIFVWHQYNCYCIGVFLWEANLYLVSWRVIYRYYLKNNHCTDPLVPDDSASELLRDTHTSFLQLQSAEIAAQLTLQDFRIFTAIQSTEYMDDLFELESKYGLEHLQKFTDVSIIKKDVILSINIICFSIASTCNWKSEN